MNSLRLEADEAAAKVEELQAKVKTLEEDNLSKEQEVTSLQHKNNVLEGEVEKLETAIKDFKKAADEGQQHGTQNETLQRRLQLLEEEAENADKTLRESNEKYVSQDLGCVPRFFYVSTVANFVALDSAKPMSKLDTSNAKCRLWKVSAISGSKNLRTCPRSTQPCRRSLRTCSLRSATSKIGEIMLVMQRKFAVYIAGIYFSYTRQMPHSNTKVPTRGYPS